jgi:long-chain acyl-CoA synthetase
VSRTTLDGFLNVIVEQDRASLLGPGVAIGMHDLDAAANQTAAYLASQGVVPGEPVIVSMANRPADLATLFGIWRAGAVAVPLNAAAPPVVHAGLKARVGARVALGPDGNESAVDARPPRRLHSNAALVIFTSGSTGTPKGVVLGHQQFVRKLEVLDRLLRIQGYDTVLVPLQLTFIFGLWVTLLGLSAGARVVLVPRFSAAAMINGLDSGATVIGVVPTMLRSLLVGGRTAASSVRLVLTGGEPFSAALATSTATMFPGATIYDLYGSTETGSCDFASRYTGTAIKACTLGQPTDGVDYRIVDGLGEPVCKETEGELQIRSPFGMLEYLDAPALTSAALSDGYFRTGDLARHTCDGEVQLVGRLKDIISRGGVKTAPLELDHLFASHPDVDAALAGGVPDERLGEAIHILIVPRHGAEIDPEALRRWAADRIERTKIPDVVHIVDALPLGSTGKADRSAIPSLYGSRKEKL